MGTDMMSGIPIRNIERPTFNFQFSTGWPKGRIVAEIWGQTRSYGDTDHWAFHDGTVESLSAVPVFFQEA